MRIADKRPAPAAEPPRRAPARLDRETRAAYGRYLARLTLKEKVENARKTDPKGYVLKAVQGMDPAKWTFDERVAEITWRIIWMFLPERTNSTLVRADTGIRGAELNPKRVGGMQEVVIGPDFLDNLDADNLDLRINMLKIVLLGKEKAIEKLKQDFGFAEVQDTSSTWTVGELAETYAGLIRMPAADRAALKGVTLRRVSTIVEHGQQFDGEFKWSFNVGADQSDPPDFEQVLKLADGAFHDPDRAAWVAVHEAGHAVENDRQRRAGFATATAQAALNKTVDPYNDAAHAAGQAMNSARLHANSYKAADRAAAMGFINAVAAAHIAINAFGMGNPIAGAAAREKAADTAIKARNDARAKLPAGNPAETDFARACDLQDDWLTAARASIAAQATRNRARDAERAVSGQQASHHDWSLRLERFVAVVNARRITPITPYARQNWPGHPEEFYAEAYTMWVNKPKQLESLAKPLKEFFDAGEQTK